MRKVEKMWWPGTKFRTIFTSKIDAIKENAFLSKYFWGHEVVFNFPSIPLGFRTVDCRSTRFCYLNRFLNSY